MDRMEAAIERVMTDPAKCEMGDGHPTHEVRACPDLLRAYADYTDARYRLMAALVDRGARG